MLKCQVLQWSISSVVESAGQGDQNFSNLKVHTSYGLQVGVSGWEGT